MSCYVALDIFCTQLATSVIQTACEYYTDVCIDIIQDRKKSDQIVSQILRSQIKYFTKKCFYYNPFFYLYHTTVCHKTEDLPVQQHILCHFLKYTYNFIWDTRIYSVTSWLDVCWDLNCASFTWEVATWPEARDCGVTDKVWVGEEFAGPKALTIPCVVPTKAGFRSGAFSDCWEVREVSSGRLLVAVKCFLH